MQFIREQKPPVFESQVFYWKSSGNIAVLHFDDGGPNPMHVGMEVGRGRQDILVGSIVRLTGGTVKKVDDYVPGNARVQYKEPEQDPREWKYAHIVDPSFEPVPAPQSTPDVLDSSTWPKVGTEFITSGVHVLVTGYQYEVFPEHKKVRVGIQRVDGKGRYAVYIETLLSWRRA